jgi:hypothetical protein
MFWLVVPAVFACNEHHETRHGQTANRHDHEKQKLFQAHGFIPFKIRLAQ